MKINWKLTGIWKHSLYIENIKILTWNFHKMNKNKEKHILLNTFFLNDFSKIRENKNVINCFIIFLETHKEECCVFVICLCRNFEYYCVSEYKFILYFYLYRFLFIWFLSINSPLFSMLLTLLSRKWYSKITTRDDLTILLSKYCSASLYSLN